MKDTELKNGGRKLWVAPKLLVIRAGSAEAGGTNNIPDGGPPGSSRS